MNTPSHTTHPMIILAAGSVTLACLVAIAWFAGWIPSKQTVTEITPAQVVASSTSSPTIPATVPSAVVPKTATSSTQETKPAAAAKSASANKTTVRKTSKQPDYSYGPKASSSQRDTTTSNPTDDNIVDTKNSPQQAQTSKTCHDCATVESIREIKQAGEGSGLGAISGGVVGGLLGNQIGGGRGKTVGAIVGAVGGAYAGHEVEKNVRSTKHYEITVRLDDGTTRVFTESQPPSLQQGDRVRINNDQLIRI